MQEKSSTQKLIELENKLTLQLGGQNPGAKRAFDAIYRIYGLPGIEALDLAGYNTPIKVWDFFHEVCDESLPEVTRRLKLGETDQPE